MRRRGIASARRGPCFATMLRTMRATSGAAKHGGMRRASRPQVPRDACRFGP
jgi:hypothetical protein